MQIDSGAYFFLMAGSGLEAIIGGGLILTFFNKI
jgi:hypothetical protein